MDRILITGLTGTSGTAFYQVLCQKQYTKPIRVLVRNTTDCRLFENAPLDLELCQGDLDDADSLHRALEGCDMVFHIAAKGKSRLLVEAIAAAGRPIKTILVSSTIVYSAYYRTSYLKEDEQDYVQTFRDAGIPYVFIRPTMIFGTPTDQNISRFVRWLKKYPIFPMVKGGRSTIQPVHREDLAEGYWLILSHFDTLQQTEYIISGQQEMTLLEMLQTISAALGKKTWFINVPFWFAKFGVQTLYILSLHRIDYREKLDRLTEDRAYPHTVISEELGFAPAPFDRRIRQLVDLLYR